MTEQNSVENASQQSMPEQQTELAQQSAQLQETVQQPVPAEHPALAQDPAPGSQSAVPRSPLARNTWLVAVVVGVVGLGIGAAAGSTITAAVSAAQYEAAEEAAVQAEQDARSQLFADAASNCGLTSVVVIADEQRTLIIDGEGEDFGSGDVDFAGLDCIIDAVGTPASVRQKMLETSSLDGRISDEWDGVSASWNYHPDDGLDIIFELDD